MNKAIGAASSGVEYAQHYRRGLLAGIDWVDDRYVFTDYIGTNLCVYTDRLGFERSRVTWIYDLVTGRETRPCVLRADDVLAAIPQEHEPLRETLGVPGCVEVALTGSPLRHRIRTVEDGLVDRVETLAGERLLRVEHYTDALHSVEHFAAGRAVRREFFTADGRLAAEQWLRDGEIARTRITAASPLYDPALPRRRGRPLRAGGELLLEGRSAFLRFVFAQLFDRDDDVVIVDRPLDVIDAVAPVIGDRRLYSVVHAEHYDLKRIEDGVLLWNNHYEHVFSRPDLVDGLIVSTERQRGILERQLARAHRERRAADRRLHVGDEAAYRPSRVSAIPVGFAAAREPAAHHDPLALVTASRLAAEKHLDTLIRAVAEARRELPGLRLDIYGEGRRDPLLAAIGETDSGSYVRLMGHRPLAGVLGAYGLYVTASTSEGFGLSLLEAIAEGLPVVGFDVDYGNREMVESGVNGLLVPCGFRDGGMSERDVSALAAGIAEVLGAEAASSGAYERMRAASLRRAADFGEERVRERWAALLGASGGGR
ncbi:glycosyltransferase [Leucobacter massiliensis]|uniref:glycosyltransferase n=1 Tax=Leucobacter massiliensis TaxID=1686285 RepID=UPI0015E3F1EC|nr:glycosyltransferase [Leucobacter massiliensis]